MRAQPTRLIAMLSAIAAALALAVALGSQHWGGLMPCALCLLERWPYRVAIILGLAAVVLPVAVARWALWLLVLTLVAGAALAAVHVGVEQGLWPSPLPECAAPHITSGSITQMLAAMPTRPSKPCDAPTYLVPGLPLSMAAMDLLYALCFAGLLAISLIGSRRGMR